MMANTSGVIVDDFGGCMKIMKRLKIAQTVAWEILPDAHSTAAKPLCEHYASAQSIVNGLRLSKRRH